MKEFDYVEVDGLLYPQIEIDGKKVLEGLGKYGRMRLEYLWECKPGAYRELLVSGKLAEHCKSMDDLGIELAEWIRGRYLERYLDTDKDVLERIQAYVTAQIVADEIVSNEVIYEL